MLFSSKEVITTINKMLDVTDAWANQRWSPEMVHGKDVIAILRLLVALATHFKAGIRLADDVALTVIVVRKINGILEYRYEREFLTERSQTAVGELRLSDFYVDLFWVFDQLNFPFLMI